MAPDSWKRRKIRRGSTAEIQRTGSARLFVSSLEKGICILQAFDTTHRELGLREIAARTGLGNSAAQRFVYTWHALGFLRKNERTRQYSLSPKVLQFGFDYLRTDALVARSIVELENSNRRCQETVNLTELDDTDIVYVARQPSRKVVSVHLLIGTRLPAYCTAPGRAMLAFLPENAALDILDRSKLAPHTPKTIYRRERILERLAEARRKGYAITDEEYFPGDLSIAAPVFDHAERVVGAVNIAVPTPPWTVIKIERAFSAEVRRCAEAISQAHGWRAELASEKAQSPGKETSVFAAPEGGTGAAR